MLPLLQFNGASTAKAAGFPAFAVWTNISVCAAEGSHTACPGSGEAPDLHACLAAGCCYDETLGAGDRSFAYPGAHELLQAAFPVPAPAAPDACWDVVDVWGYVRGQTCAVGGVLTANIT